MSNSHRSNRGNDNQAGLCSAAKAEGIFFWIMMACFGVKAMFFALRIRERVFPDEASWYGMVQVFSRSRLLPVDSPESYPLGLITHLPTLYFYLMGKVLAGNFWPIDDLVFLRVVNVVFGVLTVSFAWRLARLMGLSLAVRCLFMVMLTNTVMFTFISGAVNYDNLSTLLAVLSIYYLIRFMQGRSACHLLLSFLFILAGMLTKIVMLPYGLALVLVVFFHERGSLFFFLKSLPSWLAALRWREAAFLALCLAGLAANLTLYGGNKIRFGVLLPSMDKVLPVEDCLKNRLFTRDYVVRQFKAMKLTMLDAQRLALSIRDPGDRATAWNQLAEAEKRKKQAPEKLMGRWQYAVEWVQVIVARTYSVAAHQSIFKYEKDFYPYYAVFVLAALMWFCRFRDLLRPGIGGVGFIVLFYTMILMQGVNYPIYRSSGFSGLALTGRYMFPVLVPLYLLTAHALLSQMPRWWQITVGLAVGIFFVGGEFPWFLRQAGPEWYF